LATEDLEPGLYRLVLAGEKKEKLAEYSLRVTSSTLPNF
jgi:hypothetical protein